MEWSGTLGPGAAGAPSESSFWFVADLGQARAARATALLHWETPEDLAIAIRDEKGEQIESSDDLPGEDEFVSFDVSNGKRYEIVVSGSANAQTEFAGFLWVRSVSGRNFTGSGKLAYPAKDLLAILDVPINTCLSRRTATRTS